MPRFSVSEQVALVKEVIDGHAVNAANAGYTGPQGLPLVIGDSASRSTEARELIFKALSRLITITRINSDTDINPSDIRKWAARAYGLRALRLVAKHSAALDETSAFNIRNFQSNDLATLGNRNLISALENTLATFQYKVEPTANNAFAFTWALLVDGIMVSRGTQQPLQKFIASLLKPMQYDDALINDAQLNSIFRQLADAAPSEKLWYFYLSNQNTYKNYLLFKQTRSIDSCMSKEPGTYTQISEDQGAMDCYNNSEDWNLMFISERSPEEIRTMIEQVNGGNLGAWQYPFLSRCMVLPVAKGQCFRTRDHSYPAHFAFGKIYGHDRIVSYFTSNSNPNPLLHQYDNISGGYFPALRSTKQGYQEHFMLPYVDRANMALLVKKPEGYFWLATTERHYSNLTPEQLKDISLAARASWQEGTAKFFAAYSPARSNWVSISSYKPRGTQTILGMEYIDVDDYYTTVRTLTGESLCVPRNWTTNCCGNGEQVLLNECINLNGAFYHRSFINGNPDRFVNTNELGWLLRAHYDTLVASGAVTPIQQEQAA